MKRLAVIFSFLLFFTLPLRAEEGQDLDMNKFIFDHILDSYEWHITEINEKPVCVYLPVIVRSQDGSWHCFSSKKLSHGHSYEAFSINENGKVVETLEDGSQKRPFDISITKNVLALMVNCLVLLLVILLPARWYRRHDALKEVPKGFTGAIEMLICMLMDEVIKPCVGQDYRKYSSFLLTLFFFIFVNNLMGIVPFFPGGANVTGNIAVTFCLALFTFLAVNLFGNKHYWKDILWPDVPVPLKCPIPLMPAIEIVGMFTKPFSLMIRLFANIAAGHIMLLGVVAVVFLTAKMGAALNAGLSVFAVIFGIFMDVLELLVAFIQAYVFTMLSSVFIGMSRQH
ncbi:MAG: F0F1 ATP synthase subunit A [Candidatus Cryptobacteroides sp.]